MVRSSSRGTLETPNLYQSPARSSVLVQLVHPVLFIRIPEAGASRVLDGRVNPPLHGQRFPIWQPARLIQRGWLILSAEFFTR